MKAISFFSGMGGACTGLERAGFDVTWGNEYWEYAADVWKLNHPFAEMIRSDIRDLILDVIPTADLFWFSPPCPEFSAAKHNRSGGTDTEDTLIAEAMSRIIQAKQPEYVCIENVPGYIGSTSFRLVQKTLIGLDYHVTYSPVKMTGILPQMRVRMILVARKSRPMIGLNLQPIGLSSTWYNLLRSDQQSVEYKYYGCKIARTPYPRRVIQTCIVQRTGCSSSLKTIREKSIDQAVGTLTASMGCDGKGYFRSPYSIVEPDGTTYSLRIPALIRLAGLYDSHILGDKPGWNARMIGNAVPSVYVEWLAYQIINQAINLID